MVKLPGGVGSPPVCTLRLLVAGDAPGAPLRIVAYPLETSPFPRSACLYVARGDALNWISIRESAKSSDCRSCAGGGTASLRSLLDISSDLAVSAFSTGSL